MVTITVKHENGNGREFGYGVYVNAYVVWNDIPDDIPTLYASECVPWGQDTPDRLKAAEHRVRRNAKNRAKCEYVG